MATKKPDADFRLILGAFFLMISLLGLYWVVEIIYQLWNAPRSVALVSLFIELLEENQLPIIKSSDGAEINLPSSWSVIVGIFLSIVLISSMSVLIKLLLSKSLLLLFPEVHVKQPEKP
jgi:hypothetical protein